MRQSGLSLDQAPPADIPFRYFLTAPLFGILAGGFIFFRGNALFLNSWHVETIALTHLITLGWLAMIMFGALYQMVPVLVGGHVPAIHLARWVHAGLVLGVLFFVWGFVGSAEWGFYGAVACLTTACVVFIIQLSISLFRVKVDRPTVFAMRVSIVSFAFTVGVGILLMGQFFGWWFLPHPRLITKSIHITLGLLGWIGFLIIGVGFHVVSMFYLPQVFPVKRAWQASYALLGTLILLPVCFLLETSAVFKIVSVFPALYSIGVFLHTLFGLFQKRRRKVVDTTLNFGRQAMILLWVSLFSLLGYFVWSFEVILFVFGLLFLVGFAVSATNGMLYKIVPFLVWFHHYSPLIGKVKVPLMKDIVPHKPAHYQWLVSLTALVVILGGTLLQNDWLLRLGGGLWCVSSGYLFINLYRAVVRIRQETIIHPS